MSIIFSIWFYANLRLTKKIRPNGFIFNGKLIHHIFESVWQKQSHKNNAFLFAWLKNYEKYA